MQRIEQKIEVEEKEQFPGGWLFDVTIVEGDEATNHKIELTQSDYQEITDNQVAPEIFVRRCFEFLLDREEKEQILSEFNLTEIQLHFPEFEEAIQEMLV